ncbi:MAG: adenine deaminase [Deltaproteobacteria bacterium]|nr:adenine deaminase [Deltaproteobacteria bacterium]MBI3294399.1 adenine deaminase [Deltaproteobacteria bacterium]
MATALQSRILAAQGKIPCDTIIRNTHWLDVFTLQFRTGDVAIHGGHIVATEPGLKAKREIDGMKRFLVPGFIDAHVHLESSMMVPSNFDKSVVKKGTTTAVCDPHELANVLGIEGIQFFLVAAAKANLDLRVMLSSCVPATHMETNGGGTLLAADLVPLKAHPKALGLAEMMNFPGVLAGAPEVMEKIESFIDRPIDGHCPGLQGRPLSAYIAAGISSCHESSELEEAREKLSKGMSVWIREGSVAKDLDALVPLLNVATSIGIGFCTDDRNPLDIETEGHIDHLVRRAINRGVCPEVAFRSASWSVANHYGLRDRGAIAPGRLADIVILDDPKTVAIRDVFRLGRLASEIDFGAAPVRIMDSMKAKAPADADLAGSQGNVHIIEVTAGKILTGRSVGRHDARGVAHLSVLERHGHGGRPVNAYVRGFGEKLDGAIASSVGHDSHNLIVVGSNVTDMKTALASLIECGGGFAVVKDGQILARLELPLGGLMTSAEPTAIVDRLKTLRQASRSIGCELPEPFLQLAFLSLPVIPTLKLTDKGLVDVDLFRIISVAA